MTTLTRWVLSHKLIVVAGWVIAMVLGFALSQAATNALSQQFELPGREAQAPPAEIRLSAECQSGSGERHQDRQAA